MPSAWPRWKPRWCRDRGARRLGRAGERAVEVSGARRMTRTFDHAQASGFALRRNQCETRVDPSALERQTLSREVCVTRRTWLTDQRMLDRFVAALRDPQPDRATSARSPTRCWPSFATSASRSPRTVPPAPARAGAGNLIARMPGRGRRLAARSSPTSTPSRTTGRSRSSTRTGVYRSRGRDDPRRRQQGGGDGAARARRAPRAEPAAGRASSWSSRSPRRTGCGAPRSSTSTRCARRSASCSTTRARSAR